jgi:hypothetical protein
MLSENTVTEFFGESEGNLSVIKFPDRKTVNQEFGHIVNAACMSTGPGICCVITFCDLMSYCRADKMNFGLKWSTCNVRISEFYNYGYE